MQQTSRSPPSPAVNTDQNSPAGSDDRVGPAANDRCVINCQVKENLHCRTRKAKRVPTLNITWPQHSGSIIMNRAFGDETDQFRHITENQRQVRKESKR